MNFKRLLLLLCLFGVVFSNAQSKIDTLTLEKSIIGGDQGFFFIKDIQIFSIPTSIDTICNNKVFIQAFIKLEQVGDNDSLIFKEICHIFFGLYEIGVTGVFDEGVFCYSNNIIKSFDYDILYNDISSFIKNIFLNSVIINKMDRKNEYYILQIDGVFKKK